MKTQSTFACSVMLSLIVSIAFAQDKPGTASASKTAELLETNSIYQYKTEPVYDPKSNKSFFFWMGKTGDIYGREYNHETKAWNPSLSQESKKIMEFTRTPADRHNYPSVVIAPNGHVLVFQEDHLGSKDGYALMLYTSPKPGSIDGEWSNQTLWTEGQPSYPTAVAAGDSIYLFMRRKVEFVWRVWQFSKSDDHGKTWTEPRTIVDTQNKEPDNLNEIYSVAKKFYDPVNKRIALTWNLAGGKDHNALNKDLYMACLSTTDHKMYAPTGADLGEKIDLSEMQDPKTQVMVLGTEAQDGEKTGPTVDYTHHANYLEDGSFFITYNNMSKKNGKQSLMSARWTGSDWKHSVIEEKPFQEALTRYGSVQQVKGSHLRVSIIDDELFKVRIKETKDAGETWSQVYEETFDTQGQALNCADFIFPYRPGYPQILVGTMPSKDKHDTKPKVDMPIWALGDGTQK